MPSHTRFRCPSASLALKTLLKRTQRTLFIGMALAMGVHAALTQLHGLTEEQQTAKPLTTQFIKRQPRLTKALELRKRPRPRRRSMRRQMVAVKARTEFAQRRMAFEPTQVLRRVAYPSARIGRLAMWASACVEPTAVAGVVKGTKELDQKIHMSLELLDIEALDTGQYHAMVIQDTGDKRDLKGFCRLGAIFVPEFYINRPEGNYSFEFQAEIGLRRLVQFMNAATDVNTEVLGRVALNDKVLYRAPWVLFNPTKPSHLGATQHRNLGQYLLAGGFVFGTGIACYVNMYGIHRAAFRSLNLALMESLRECGVTATKERLPQSHPVYHCYFDSGGPPGGCDVFYAHANPGEVHIAGYVEGIELEGRLLALLSGKAYGYGWAIMGPGGIIPAGYSWDPTPAFRFGVNTVVLALTQEGSITRRLMDSVR